MKLYNKLKYLSNLFSLFLENLVLEVFNLLNIIEQNSQKNYQ